MSQEDITTQCGYAPGRYVDANGCVEFVTIDGQTWYEESFFAPRSGFLPLSAPAEVPGFMNSLVPEGGTAMHLGAEWATYALLPRWNGLFVHPDGAPDEMDSETRKVLVVLTDGDLTMTHENGLSTDEAYEYFQSVCKFARDSGIGVYTIGLKTSAKTDTELTKCAGKSSRYFPADSRTQIKKAFESIAKDAVKLHISG